jgi:lipopolysaccharide biosynthesis protein
MAPPSPSSPSTSPQARVSRSIIMAHYDRSGDLDPHVLHALREYRRHARQLVLVSASLRTLPAAARSLIDTFIPRRNEAYDFGSWQTGLRSLSPGDDEILCVNDSVYGPLFDLAPALSAPQTRDADLWGMVLSDQSPRPTGPRHRPHVQSWFFGMRRRLIESAAFDRFWAAVRPLPTKLDVIEQFELGLSEHVVREGFRIAAIYDTRTAGRLTIGELWPHLSLASPARSWGLVRKASRATLNPSELTWWRLLEAGVPFVKVAIFRTNHYRVDLRRIVAELRLRAPRHMGLIHDHLARCG